MGCNLKCENCKKATQLRGSSVYCSAKNRRFHKDFICKGWIDKDGTVEGWEKELLTSLQINDYNLWLSEKQQVAVLKRG